MPPISLGTTQTLIDALATGRKIFLEAYILRNPRVIGALEHAAERGAQVEVRLCGNPVERAGSSRLQRQNARLQAALRAHGVDASLDRSRPAALHAKVARVDGRAFFDDRNWGVDARETVIVDDDRRDADGLVMSKRAALAREAAMIRRSRGGHVIVSTEAVSPGVIVDALIERARRGDDVRLLFDGTCGAKRRDAALSALRAAGVRTRVSSEHRKLAAAGGRVWIGSANASGGAAAQVEWSLGVGGRIAERIGAVLERAWSRADEFRA